MYSAEVHVERAVRRTKTWDTRTGVDTRALRGVRSSISWAEPPEL